MFTGIIEELGKINDITFNGTDNIIDIKCMEVLTDTRIGDSIAVNGVCLTVTSMSKERDRFTADVMPETFRSSSLAELKKGDYVNLERAMLLNGRMGGHIVSGHVDMTGKIKSISPEDNAIIYEVRPEKNEELKYIVRKGSVAIDGISLTVFYVDDEVFKVSIIPHTAEETVLKYKKVGSTVNIECDIIGKYVDRLLNFKDNGKEESSLTLEKLRAYGF
ncbi:riboflavin synthase alpha chain [Lachnospiraceae bacterium RM5]|nr:riboflavin synthase alpha chain [Lachnospiraceae bacterium RM5]